MAAGNFGMHKNNFKNNETIIILPDLVQLALILVLRKEVE